MRFVRKYSHSYSPEACGRTPNPKRGKRCKVRVYTIDVPFKPEIPMTPPKPVKRAPVKPIERPVFDISSFTASTSLDDVPVLVKKPSISDQLKNALPTLDMDEDMDSADVIDFKQVSIDCFRQVFAGNREATQESGSDSDQSDEDEREYFTKMRSELKPEAYDIELP
jgi:hypothetical protein